jgi:hypothetical protein
MNDWGNLLIKLQGYKKLAHEETDVLKKEV